MLEINVQVIVFARKVIPCCFTSAVFNARRHLLRVVPVLSSAKLWRKCYIWDGVSVFRFFLFFGKYAFVQLLTLPPTHLTTRLPPPSDQMCELDERLARTQIKRVTACSLDRDETLVVRLSKWVRDSLWLKYKIQFEILKFTTDYGIFNHSTIFLIPRTYIHHMHTCIHIHRNEITSRDIYRYTYACVGAHALKYVRVCVCMSVRPHGIYHIYCLNE